MIDDNYADRRARVKEDLDALLDLGLPLATARRIANWSEYYEHNPQVETWPPGTVVPLPTDGLRESVKLLVTRSEARANSDELDGSALDAGKLYAVHVVDVPELSISSITFHLNNVPVHTEASVPWDYAGTTPGGDANRVVFVVGSHIIRANVTDSEGIFSVEASFNVE